MNSAKKKSIVFLVVISGRKQKDALLTFLTDLDANVVHTIYGKGSVKPNSFLIEVLGFVPDENKVIITCLLSHDDADLVIDRLEKKFDFNKANTGIAFTIDVESLSF